MTREFHLNNRTGCFVERKRYHFKTGPLGYEVVYYLDKEGSRSYVHLDFPLRYADREPMDPNLNYARLDEILTWGVGLGPLHKGYGISRTTVYAFPALATLAAIVREIVGIEHPDELRFSFFDTSHSSFWKKFIR